MTLPTSLSERYSVLDVLRGFALLGVILANMVTHNGYFFMSSAQQEALSTAEIDHIVEWTLHFLVDGKFYSLFSMLFGIGFALQLKRSGDLTPDFKKRYRRRLLILFFMGLLHAILFYVGDILTVYAMIGFSLFLFIKASDRALLRGAFILMLLPIIQYAILLVISLSVGGPPPQAAEETRPPFFDQIILTYQTGTHLEMIQNNIGGLIFGRYPDLIFTGRFFRVLAMFLLGMYITRHMLFANLEVNRPLFKKVLIAGLLIGLPCNLVLAMMMETDAYYQVTPLGIIQPVAYAFGVPALCLFYASAVALLYTNQKWQSILNVFAPVGQMALTNYLMQSLICCLIFKGYGLGLYAKVGPAILTLIALGIFLFQLIFSKLWLKRYRFGPMEWLWRSLTYKKTQSMQREVIPV